jgi:hypothetical protein
VRCCRGLCWCAGGRSAGVERWPWHSSEPAGPGWEAGGPPRPSHVRAHAVARMGMGCVHLKPDPRPLTHGASMTAHAPDLRERLDGVQNSTHRATAFLPELSARLVRCSTCNTPQACHNGLVNFSCQKLPQLRRTICSPQLWRSHNSGVACSGNHSNAP